MERAGLTSDPGLTTDHLLDGKIRLCQPAEGYRAAIDPVFLAASIAAGPGERILELGCGVGTAALCLARRVPAARIVGMDAEPELIALARLNASANNLEDSLTFHEGDVLAPCETVITGGFDQVFANPPFLRAERATVPEARLSRVSDVEGVAGLQDWLAAMLRLVRPKGRLTVIHRPDRLGEILAGLQGRAGDVRVLPMWPRQGSAAKRIIVAARRGVKTPMRLQPGLVLHEGDRYTAEAERVLRSGHGIAGLWE